MARFLRPGDRVLFQGDSITNAFRMPGERNTAYQLGAGYPLLVASHVQSRRPAEQISFVNRGVAGETLSMIAARWTADCLELRPTVLVMLAGTNDVGIPTFNPARFGREYYQLLERTAEALPSVRFVICEPFSVPGEVVDAERMARMAACRAATRTVAETSGSLLVPLGAAFDQALHEASPEYWCYDGIHPTAAGHGLIAQSMLAALGEASD